MPSFGVTVTVMASPATAFPATAKLSVSAVALVNVRRTVPFTRQTKVRLTGSPSKAESNVPLAFSLISVAFLTEVVP